MGLMDKAKQAAMQAKEQAQHMAQQGQAKVAQVQQTRESSELYKTLGEAYYNAQRHGGDQAAVDAALAALDAHAEAAAAAPAPDAGAAPPAPGGGVVPPPSPAAPPAGDFTLDDV